MKVEDVKIEDVIESIAPDGIFIHYSKSRNLKHLREEFSLNARDYFLLYNALKALGIKERKYPEYVHETIDEQEILDHYGVLSLEELDTH